jgi:hypothetical protein
MDRMCASHPVFMRCLKPNQQKQAHLFDETFVRAQVRSKFFFQKKKFRYFNYLASLLWYVGNNSNS